MHTTARADRDAVTIPIPIQPAPVQPRGFTVRWPAVFLWTLPWGLLLTALATR